MSRCPSKRGAMVTTVGLHDRWALLTAILVGNVYVGLEPTVGLCDADPCGETYTSQAHPTSALRTVGATRAR